MPNFLIKTIAFKEKIEQFLIIDILLLNYKGDHMLCESHTLILIVIFKFNNLEIRDC